MPKIKYDVSDVEPGRDFDTPLPKGTYRMKVADVTEGESKSSGKPMLTVEYEMPTGEHKGRKLWDYIVLEESSAWKLRQFVDAVGAKAKGTLDTDKVVGERVLVRVKHETDDRDPDDPVVRARVGSVSAIPDDAEDEDDDDDADDDDEPTRGSGADDSGDDDELTAEDLDEYDRDDLEALIEEEDLDVKHNSKTKLPVLRERIAEALGLDDEDDEEEDDDEDEADYSELSLADLKAELKDRGLPVRGPKAKLVARLEDDDNESTDPF